MPQGAKIALPRRARAIANVCILLIGGAVAIWYIQTSATPAWDFRHNLYSPIYSLMHGTSPYLPNPLFEGIYPTWWPPAIGLFIPLGGLTESQAINAWFLWNIFLAVMLIRHIGQCRQNAPLKYLLCLFAVFLFPPLISHLALGQLSLFGMSTLLLASYFVKRGNIAPAGFLAAVSLSKPQLAIFAIPGLLIASYRSGGWTRSLSFTGYLVFSILILMVPLWLLYPPWPFDFVDGLSKNPTWLQPNLFSILTSTFPTWGLAGWAVVAFGLFLVNTRLWIGLVPTQAIIGSLAITVIASPYIWTWDFVLMLPAVIYGLTHARATSSQLVVISGYAITASLGFWMRLNTSNEQLFWWMPYMLLVTSGLGYLLDLFAKRTPRIEFATTERPFGK